MGGRNEDKVDHGAMVEFVEMTFETTWVGAIGSRKKAAKKVASSKDLVEPTFPSDKWLYVFWAKGKRYRFSENSGRATPGGGTHVGWSRGEGKNNEKNSHPVLRAAIPQATDDCPEHIWRELKYQEGSEGIFEWLDIGPPPTATPSELNKTPLWKNPGRDRPLPYQPEKTDKDKSKKMTLPLTTGGARTHFGEPVRYYFLLSPVRLGRNALNAALTPNTEQDGLGADALSVLTVGMLSEHNHNYDDAPGLDDLKALPTLWRVGVVDPYSLAEQLNSHLLRCVQKYAEYKDDLAFKELGKHYLYTQKNWEAQGITRASVMDAYFIAKTIQGMRPDDLDTNEESEADDFSWTDLVGGVGWEALKKADAELREEQEAENWEDWSADTAEWVISTVERTEEEAKNTLEAQSHTLATWLENPAHCLIDLAVVEDTDDGGDYPMNLDKRTGPGPWGDVDRAYALFHWYNVTSLLPMTDSGVEFLQGKGVGSDNPVSRILLGYGDQAVAKVDQLALVRAGVVVPDLVIRFTLLDAGWTEYMEESYSKEQVARKLKKVRDLANNIGLFPDQLKIADETDEPGLKRWVDAGLALSTTTVESGVEGILDEAWDPNKPLRGATHLKRAGKWAAGNAAPIGLRSKEIQAVRGAHYGAKVFAAIASLASMSAGGGAEASKEENQKKAIFKTVIDLAGVVDPILKFTNVDTDAWSRLAPGRTRSFSAALFGQTVAKTAAISFIGVLSGIHTIWSGLETIESGRRTADTSVTEGGKFIVFGGTIALAASVVHIPLLGWAAAPLVFLGGLIAALTRDDPLTVFMRHCVFSKAHSPGHEGFRSYTNTRRFGGKDHWAGQKRVRPPGRFDRWIRDVDEVDEYWPVTDQRWALENILSAFKVESHIDSLDKDVDFLERRARPGFGGIEMEVSLGYVPTNARLELEVVGDDIYGLETGYLAKEMFQKYRMLKLEYDLETYTITSLDYKAELVSLSADQSISGFSFQKPQVQVVPPAPEEGKPMTLRIVMRLKQWDGDSYWPLRITGNFALIRKAEVGDVRIHGAGELAKLEVVPIPPANKGRWDGHKRVHAASYTADGPGWY